MCRFYDCKASWLYAKTFYNCKDWCFSTHDIIKESMRENLNLQNRNPSKLQESAYLGIRCSIGVIFIVYGLQKFDPIWNQILSGFGLPPELRIPIALAETIGGTAMILGILTRITGVIFGLILVDAIFHIRWENGFFIANGGWDYDLALLSMAVLIITVGPSYISVSSRWRRIPKILQ